MEKKELKLWEDFRKEIEDLFSRLKEREKDPEASSPSHPYFRGQSNSDWGLKTTLDRIEENFSCDTYYQTIKIAARYIESFTGVKWNIEEKEKKKKTSSFWETPDGYEFMVYLRHHGFPSPLLDWTLSPYLAAFFAFSNLTKEKRGNVAIFAYVDDIGYGVSGSSDKPYITTLGPTITTHKRHHLQQSVYTICQKKQNKNKPIYWDHEKTIEEKSSNEGLLIKYILPISEKAKALKELDRMNINAYSLFNSEESLMHTLAIRRFFIRKF